MALFSSGDTEHSSSFFPELFGFNLNAAIKLYYTKCCYGISPDFSLCTTAYSSLSICKCDIIIRTIVSNCTRFDCIFRYVPGFSVRTLVPSFVPYCLPMSSQVNSDSMSQRSIFRISSRVMFELSLSLICNWWLG